MASCDSSQKDGGALPSIFWPSLCHLFCELLTQAIQRPRKVKETWGLQVCEAGEVQESPIEAGRRQAWGLWTNVLVEAVRSGLMHLWVKNAG